MARGSFYTTEKLGPKQSLTPEGFLLCEEVPIARTGMMIYGPDETPIKAGPDGIAKIYREPDDVFKPETLASAQGKSVANDHPEEDVVPENWKELTVGVMLNPRRGVGAMDDLMLADLLITTTEGIEAVRSGKVEVSLGYDADYEEVSPGIGKQSNIIINHVALVEQGRCGIRCAIGDAKTTGKEPQMATKFKDLLMKAFKAKDAAEVEKLAEEATKDDITGGQGAATGEETHVHVHLAGDPEAGSEGAGATGEPGRASFSDDDIQEHMDTNAAEHAEMRAEIAELRQMIEAMSGGGAAEGDDGEVMDDAEMEANLEEEAPAGMGEEATKAKDSKYLADSFQDTVAMAEILAPGIKVPTFDAAAKPGQSFKKICGLRRAALDAAYANPKTRLTVADLIGGKTLDTKNMTCDAIRTLFRSAVAIQRTQNMAPRASVADAAEKKTASLTIAELNRRNAERYKY